MSTGFLSIEDLLPKNNQKQKTAGAVGSSSSTPSASSSDSDSSERILEERLEEKMHSFALDEQEQETETQAASLGVPYVNLEGFPIAPEVLGLIPEEDAHTNTVVAFFRLENQIRVGAVDPKKAAVVRIAKDLTAQHEGTHVEIYMISQHSFERASKLYKNIAKVKQVEYGVHITPEQVKKYQEELQSYAAMEERLKTANMTDAFAILISMALNSGSSDVHIEAEEKSMVVRFRVDGVLTVVAHLSKEIQRRFVNRIKTIAGIKINITEVPQDGRITIDFSEDDSLDIRVSTLPSAFGESIVFRLLKSSSVGLSFEDLGMRPKVYERLKAEIEKPNGMIITTGPTGSGKTTTLYAVLNKLNQPDTKIITLENPIEYKLKGIVQSQVEAAKKYSFALGLRAILRQDPDIVMVGEIRDFETAKTAIDAALTGHLMLSTIHTNDASGVIPRFLGMGVQGIFLAPALNAVIGQRLVRKICGACKKEYTPPQNELDRMKEWIARIPENSGEARPDVSGVTFFHGEGCDVCSHTGYKGRVGIYEVFTMSAEIEQQILSGKVSEFQMKDILYRAGMVTMGQDGVLKVIDGVTTLDEVFRVAKE